LARGIVVLLSKIEAETTEDQSLAVAQAIMAAASSSASPLRWDETGLVVAAVLLQPSSAGKPTKFLVTDYQKLLQRTPDAPQPPAPWSEDVWDFVAWATINLPSFDRHEPKLGFLPSTQSGVK
jgi:hypothetical protein